MSRKQHDRWVSLVYPNGHAKTIRRTEAQQMLQDGAVEYGGEKDGRTWVVIKTVFVLRKTRRMGGKRERMSGTKEVAQFWPRFGRKKEGVGTTQGMDTRRQPARNGRNRAQ